MEQTVFEEDIEAAVATAVSIFGPQGRLLYGERAIVYNAKLTTEPHGTLWYGDITMDELDRVTKLADRLNTQVTVQMEGPVTLDAIR